MGPDEHRPARSDVGGPVVTEPETVPGPLTKLALSYRCPRCRSHGWCKSKDGVPASVLHAGRLEPVRAAFAAGYMTGLTDGKGA